MLEYISIFTARDLCKSLQNILDSILFTLNVEYVLSLNKHTKKS